ncbi:MAG: 4-oxalomesaconate tautomerase [Rhodospirillales bacterium]|nr:4-oxalomesaconate tautomerase [Rhodospirillales bacterium]
MVKNAALQQTAIPSVLMRGGSSKGLFFLASDLPSDIETRDNVLLAAMGSPDVRQIDGIGGADPLTSKVAIVSRSDMDGVDIDFLFAQVSVDAAKVDTSPNCGNMLAGVGPFAIEHGLIDAIDPETVVRIHTVNTGMIADAAIQTPGGVVNYGGDARIDSVPGSSAPVKISFLDIAGSVCGTLLPTGKTVDTIQGIEVTCVDNGMPVVVMRAEDMGITGYESRDQLNNDDALKARLEELRIPAGELMRLGDVSERVVPKMTMVAAPRDGGAICTRTFIPRVCHASIGVLGAVSAATACVFPGTPGNALSDLPDGAPMSVSVEHPSGEFTIELDVDYSGDLPTVRQAALLRTTRKLFAGQVFIPGKIWDGVTD